MFIFAAVFITLSLISSLYLYIVSDNKENKFLHFLALIFQAVFVNATLFSLFLITDELKEKNKKLEKNCPKFELIQTPIYKQVK